MAIDFNKTFGEGNNKGNVGEAAGKDRPKAQFWLNIGYDSGVKEENSEATRFVSLPTGIPLDSQDRLPTNSRNGDFAAFQSARNDLLDQIIAKAKTLKPGEEVLLNLQIQLRRVNEEAAEIPASENKFGRNLSL